jgi:uncharacterized protein
MPFLRRMRSIPLSDLIITDPFWSRYQRTLLEKTLPAQFEQLEKTDRFANFRRAAGQEEGPHVGLYFNDSDVYKFIEACAYALAAQPSSKNVEKVETQMYRAIELVVSAQQPDGYLNTFFQLNHPDLKWRNLNSLHEMYCGGHLIEAGVAVFESVGDRTLLDVAIRFADHVMSVFGPEKRLGYPGHEEIELALIRLAIVTQATKYRDFARWLVESRGQKDSPFSAELDDPESVTLCPGAASQKQNGVYNGEYSQDHAPIREHTEIVGHAVRAMYLYIAATDLADGQSDLGLESALERVWTNLTHRRMYVTGGIGPSSRNEGFTSDYDLPNLTAYAETCAAIGLVFWGHRLLELTGNGEYFDVVERALYNGVISGISLEGTEYFYDNPLESRGTHQRSPWFGCACCPPNIARILGSIGQYALGMSEKDFYIHSPIGFKTTQTLNGVPVNIALEGNYPWSGEFTIRIEPTRPVRFALKLRIPDWADDVNTDLPGAEEEADYESGYAVFDRTWKSDDVLKVELTLQPKWLEANPKVRDNLGRAALTRGPLVYCAESPDLGYAPQLFSADVEAEVGVNQENLLPGITTMSVEGIMDVEAFVEGMYAELGTTDSREAEAKFIPYYAWSNRGPSHMQVWVRRI